VKTSKNSIQRIIQYSLVAGVVGFLAACDSEKPFAPPASSSAAAPAPKTEPAAATETAKSPEAMPDAGTREFIVRGLIKEIRSGGLVAIIEHEEIPDFMDKMIMPFSAKDPKEFAERKANDQVTFRLLVSKTESWVDRVTKTGDGPINLKEPRRDFRPVRDVQPLEIGQVIPNYPLTNELGRAVSLHEFKGKAVALTFVFTRCPLPDFCPRMTGNFHGVYDELTADTSAPSNWHLLSLSFDVDHDTPAVLNGYAKANGCDSKRWSFLTGALIEIDAITEQFGLGFAREVDGPFIFSHNLRTIVLDPRGRIQRMFIGNDWSAKELAAELRKAAKIPMTDSPRQPIPAEATGKRRPL
jgi:protein SCO1/2